MTFFEWGKNNYESDKPQTKFQSLFCQRTVPRIPAKFSPVQIVTVKLYF